MQGCEGGDVDLVVCPAVWSVVMQIIRVSLLCQESNCPVDTGHLTVDGRQSRSSVTSSPQHQDEHRGSGGGLGLGQQEEEGQGEVHQRQVCLQHTQGSEGLGLVDSHANYI